MSFIKHIVFGIFMLLGFGLYAQQSYNYSVFTILEIRNMPVLQSQASIKYNQNIQKVALKIYFTSTLNKLLLETTNIVINKYDATGFCSVSMRDFSTEIWRNTEVNYIDLFEEIDYLTDSTKKYKRSS